MTTVGCDQLPKYMSGSPLKDTKVSESIGRLTGAFCHFLHGKPFSEDMKRIDWSILLTAPQIVFFDLLDHLTRQPEYAVFTWQIDSTILRMLYNMKHVAAWRKMEPALDKETLAAVFWDNPLIGERLRNDMRDAYLYNVELLATSQLQEVRQKMAGGTHGGAL